ncbi:hypothetical protein D3C75_495290 [compost metagenome]
MRQNGRRNTKLGVFPALHINPRRGQQQLARVDKILLPGIAFKPVPFRPRLKTEETQLAGNRLGRMILPRTPGHHRRNKRLDHFAVGDNRLARLNAERDALCPESTPALPFVDLGVHVQGSKQRVKRTG